MEWKRAVHINTRVLHPIRLPGNEYDASSLIWPPSRHPAKQSKGLHCTNSLYDRHPAAVATVVRAELFGAADHHHRLLALDRNRSSAAEREIALKDIEHGVRALKFLH